MKSKFKMIDQKNNQKSCKNYVVKMNSFQII